MKPVLKSRFFILKSERYVHYGQGRSSMKILLGFFMGVALCLLLVLTMPHDFSSASAEENTVTSSDNIDISGRIPAIGKIYREALGGPYRQVESEITVPDIARFFLTYV